MELIIEIEKFLKSILERGIEKCTMDNTYKILEEYSEELKSYGFDYASKICKELAESLQKNTHTIKRKINLDKNY